MLCRRGKRGRRPRQELVTASAQVFVSEILSPYEKWRTSGCRTPIAVFGQLNETPRGRQTSAYRTRCTTKRGSFYWWPCILRLRTKVCGEIPETPNRPQFFGKNIQELLTRLKTVGRRYSHELRPNGADILAGYRPIRFFPWPRVPAKPGSLIIKSRRR